MALEIAVGPRKLVLNQGSSFAVTDQDGQINWPTDKGVYYPDTRMILSWRIVSGMSAPHFGGVCDAR